MGLELMQRLPDVVFVLAVAWSVVTLFIAAAAVAGRGWMARWRWALAAALWVAWVVIR